MNRRKGVTMEKVLQCATVHLWHPDLSNLLISGYSECRIMTEAQASGEALYPRGGLWDEP